jgi:hypothetical protein
MIREDVFGYDLTLRNPAALDSWTATIQAFLAHGAATPVRLAETLEKAPDFALAHTAKSFFMMLLGRSELVQTAREAHAEATRLMGNGATARERAYLGALTQYLGGDMHGAAASLDRLLTVWPRDSLAMKIGQSIKFVLGDGIGMRRSIEAIRDGFGADHPHLPYLKGCHAFALEETGDYLGAEALGRDAVLRAADDAWGVHAVAHVFDMTNRTREGVAWLSGQPETWAHCNNFRYHVWWHLALFHLDRGEHEEVLRLYDTEIRAEHTDDYRDISNGASLLSRLEIDGVDVGNRWEEMAQICENRTDDGCVVFADLHYMLALGGGDRNAEANALLTRMQADAAERNTSMKTVTAEAGLPAARGLMNFANGDYDGAFADLSAARPNMQSVGGSHAQRDVFERITIESALRAGRLDSARSLIDDRTRRRGSLDGYAERRLERIGDFQESKAAAR